jgi:hypothetical protein
MGIILKLEYSWNWKDGFQTQIKMFLEQKAGEKNLFAVVGFCSILPPLC